MATMNVATMKNKVGLATDVVPHADWVAARKELLRKEKEFTRLRDELSRQRRTLPRERVEKKYVFDGPGGKETLADLFGTRSQLIVYHFMLGPGWTEGCPSCSFLADTFDGAAVHLAHRDVSFVAISRATLPEIETFKKRMGWQFKWVSSFGSEFNYDYQVSLSQEEKASGKVYYNYEMTEFGPEERPGTSVFYKDEAGEIFHTYSSYGRGLDPMIGTYNWLDLTPKGRDEDGLVFSMAWVRHHDKYVDGQIVDPKAQYVQPAKVDASCCSEKGTRVTMNQEHRSEQGERKMTRMVDPMLNEFREEAATTKRVLERVPADKLTWKPHRKSMSLGQLALHIASVPGSLARISQLDEFDVAQANFDPPAPKDIEQIHAALQESIRAAEECLSSMSEQKAMGNWRLMTNGKQIFNRPRVEVIRSIMLNHWYHHRGQLSVYLRMLEVPVPVIYGRSADENPFA